MLHNSDIRIRFELFANLDEHGLREIKAHELRLRASLLHDRNQPAGPCAQIQNAARISGYEVDKSGFAFAPARNRIHPL